MKKVFLVALVAAIAFVAASCGTTQAAPQGDPVGDFISEARRTANENALLGIGTARHSNRSLATQTATARALADIARQLNVVVSNMITDYLAGSEAEPDAMLAFQESVTQTLAQERLVGTRPIAERMIDGEMVVVMELSPSNAATNIMTASESAAALAPHMGAAMWALDRMDQALQQQNMAPPVIRNYD